MRLLRPSSIGRSGSSSSFGVVESDGPASSGAAEDFDVDANGDEDEDAPKARASYLRAAFLGDDIIEM